MNGLAVSTLRFRIRFRYSASRLGIRRAPSAIASTSACVLKHAERRVGLLDRLYRKWIKLRDPHVSIRSIVFLSCRPSASSINTDSKSASVGACVEIIMLSGFSCAAVAVSIAS